MRLSEAIRLGAMLKPQTFGGDVRAGTATCALGAALDAIGRLNSELPYNVVQSAWPVARTVVAYPCGTSCKGAESYDYTNDLYRVVWHLNDGHRWTREAIADWVQTIEESQTVADEGAQEHARVLVTKE